MGGSYVHEYFSHLLTHSVHWVALDEIDNTHLVTALSTPDVDDDVTVRELRQSLRDDGLATAEGARNSGGTTLHTTMDH